MHQMVRFGHPKQKRVIFYLAALETYGTDGS